MTGYLSLLAFSGYAGKSAPLLPRSRTQGNPPQRGVLGRAGINAPAELGEVV